MLPKKYRLSKKIDIERVKKGGTSISNDLLTFIVEDVDTKSFSRFCIIVSTKISKKAVVRNKIKRMVSTIIENRLEEIKDGKNIVIIVKKDLSIVDSKVVDIKINEGLYKIKALK